MIATEIKRARLVQRHDFELICDHAPVSTAATPSGGRWRSASEGSNCLRYGHQALYLHKVLLFFVKCGGPLIEVRRMSCWVGRGFLGRLEAGWVCGPFVSYGYTM